MQRPKVRSPQKRTQKEPKKASCEMQVQERPAPTEEPPCARCPLGAASRFADLGRPRMAPALSGKVQRRVRKRRRLTKSRGKRVQKCHGGLFVQPESFVPGGVELCAPHGFDLTAAGSGECGQAR